MKLVLSGEPTKLKEYIDYLNAIINEGPHSIDFKVGFGAALASVSDYSRNNGTFTCEEVESLIIQSHCARATMVDPFNEIPEWIDKNVKQKL